MLVHVHLSSEGRDRKRLLSLWVLIALSSRQSRDFSGVSVVKNPPANAGDTGDSGLIPGSGRSPGRDHGTPLQHSCLENPTTGEPGGLQSTGSQSQTGVSIYTHQTIHIPSGTFWGRPNPLHLTSL